jgi:hypothetical protein
MKLVFYERQQPICSQSLAYALKLLKPELDSLSLVARGSRIRSRTIGKSTQLTGEVTKIVKTVDITKTVSSSPQIRKRRGISVSLTMQRSGARFIVPQDTIWKSAKLFRIAERCH